ncbi:MAG: phosphate acyltransferase PlsX [Limisphaerales bacterium]|nr:phosphate acyltransferase PlsX [Verrucomicrobiota bacterium]
MRIAVDVMGGDHGCGVIVDGVIQALNQLAGLETAILVGREPDILKAFETRTIDSSRLKIQHADEVLAMDDRPMDAVRRKKDCSITVGVNLLKQGEADAFLSPGNTGGVVTASTVKLRRLPGLERAGIATVLPTPQNDFVLLDAGANVDSKPIHLAHYAVMGNVYAREILGIPNPRVGILSVGTEDIKGNDLTLEAFSLCKQLDLNFVGNVEGHDLFSNRVDVVVCDGFVGNVVLKSCESLAQNLFSWLREELTAGPVRKIGALMAKGAFRTIKRRMDPDAYGGAPLLGLNSNVFIAHGSAGAKAVKNAIRMTYSAFDHQINQQMTEAISMANEKMEIA